MKLIASAAVSALAIVLTGCVSPLEDTTQDMTIVTDPPGATCVLVRTSMELGTIPSTPGTVHISKGRYDIKVTCNKAGYREAVYISRSAHTEPVLNNNAPRPDNGHYTLDQNLNYLDSGTMMYEKAVKITMRKLDDAPAAAAPTAKPGP